MTKDDLLGQEINLFRRKHTIEQELRNVDERLIAVRCSLDGYTLAETAAAAAAATSETAFPRPIPMPKSPPAPLPAAPL